MNHEAFGWIARARLRYDSEASASFASRKFFVIKCNEVGEHYATSRARFISS